jgi:Flagellar biosynthesis protein, FliO
MDFLTPYMNYIVTAGIALAVLIVGLLIYKALGGPVMGRKGQRLGISEYHEIDKTRRLVLVRRDETEHLILIGGGQDIVIESGISLSNGMEDMREPVRPPIPIRAAPRAPVFGDRRPTLRPVEPPMMSQRNYEHEDN